MWLLAVAAGQLHTQPQRIPVRDVLGGHRQWRGGSARLGDDAVACQQPVVRLQVTPQNLRWMQSRHRSLAIFRMRACTHVIRVYCGRNAECKNTVMISMWRAAGVQLGRLWRRCDARFDSAPGRAGAHRPPLSLCMRLYMVAAPSASDNNTLGFASPVCMALTLPYRLSLAVPRLCEQVRSQQPACAGSVPWPQPHTSAALTAAQRLFLKQFLMCAMQTASCSSGACPALAAPCLCFDIPPGNSNFTCGQEARSCSPTPSPPADSLSQFPAPFCTCHRCQRREDWPCTAYCSP